MKFPWVTAQSALAASSLLATDVTRNCVSLDIPVSVSATNNKYDTLRIDSNIDAVEWTRDIDKWNAKPLGDRNLGPLSIEGNFNISAQLCVAEGAKATTLQIASHGFGLNKKYWDIRFQPTNYSYVDAVLAAGHSVLTYDRLGSGNSSHPDAYDVLQTPLQAEVLKELTTLSKSGDLLSTSVKGEVIGDGVNNFTASQVIHVGHSYGSAVTNHFLSQYGNLSAGALLTGFLVTDKLALLKVEVADLAYAAETNSTKWGDRGSGYVAFGSRNAFVLDSLRKQTLDLEMLDVWDHKLQDAGAIGELLSLGVSFGAEIKGFKGPLQMVVGEFDFPYCAGDCNGVFDEAQIKTLYPDAKDFSVYLQPETGHCLTMSTNATAGYKVMLDFLGRNGL